MNLAEQFYTDHASCKLSFPKPIDGTDEELVRWIFSQNIPFIDIDVEFNIDTWREETANALPFLVPHRESDSIGWNSCCIHGIDVNKTGVWQNYTNTEPKYNWTSLAELTPSIKKFWQSMPFERFARIRFMELEAHGNILPHNDAPVNFNSEFNLLDHLLPINIAVIHPDNCYMTLEGQGTIPWTDGNVKLVNITNTHSVINFSEQNRIHMIGHGLVGNKFKEFCELIARSYKKQYERYRI